MIHCDPITGACLLPEQDKPVVPVPPAKRSGWAVHYVGDPMCSWCWGISPTVGEVAAFCAAAGIEFLVTVGGLRAGGGDPWNEKFKAFLRTEWNHIAEVTGQPFGCTLLDLPQFDYDTEPACRAVAAIKLLQARDSLDASTVLKFFSAVQRKFYVEGEDPKATDFYRDICAGLGLDFDIFHSLFESAEARQAVRQEFVRCRQWGVRSFPTLLLEQGQDVTPLAVGFVTTEQVIAKLRQAITAAG
ncbi:MAG: DsbA family protein [Castellaniella sp.]|uniref:DsbA family protein n=1 Tax=Castellaniella sp. TaxID=1955812 RepID=UPI002A35C32C|nr:DsbA family protein [Castellaniella sp.]MDY0308481.1 DsbA family protein [Castellaniella sp.]